MKQDRIKRARLAAAFLFVSLTAGMTAACQQQPKVDYITNAGWEAALADLKAGSGERDKVVQGCVLQFYADFYKTPEELPLRQTIGGILDVSIGAAFKVFCDAFVEAAVHDRLTADDYKVFLDEATASHGGELGRVSREVQATHSELLRIRAEKAAQS